MTKPIHERAKEKAEKSKHYQTARSHAMNALGYFALFAGSVVVDHVVDEWKSRKISKPLTSDEDEDNTTFLQRILAGC